MCTLSDAYTILILDPKCNNIHPRIKSIDVLLKTNTNCAIRIKYIKFKFCFLFRNQKQPVSEKGIQVEEMTPQISQQLIEL